MLTALSKELSEIRIVTNLSEDLVGKNKEIFGLNQVIKDQKSELELIEPELWFRFKEESAYKLAEIIKDFLNKLNC